MHKTIIYELIPGHEYFDYIICESACARKDGYHVI